MAYHTVAHMLKNKTGKISITHCVIPRGETFQTMEPCGSTQEFYIVGGKYTAPLEMSITPFHVYKIQLAKRDNIGYGEAVKPTLYNNIKEIDTQAALEVLQESVKKATLESLVNLVVEYVEYYTNEDDAKQVRDLTCGMLNSIGNKIKDLPASYNSRHPNGSQHHIMKGGLIQHTAEMLGMFVHGIDIKAGGSIKPTGHFSPLNKASIALAILFHDLGKLYTLSYDYGIKPSGHVAASLALIQSYITAENLESISDVITEAYAIIMLSHYKSQFYNRSMREAIGKYYTLKEQRILALVEYIDYLDHASASTCNAIQDEEPSN